MSIFIQRGADVNLIDFMGRTPLHWAITAPGAPIDMFKLLISPENINIHDAGQNTPLHLAVNVNQLEFLTHLLNHGADVNVVDINILHYTYL